MTGKSRRRAVSRSPKAIHVTLVTERRVSCIVSRPGIVSDKCETFAYVTRRSLQEAAAAIRATDPRAASAHHQLAVLHARHAASIIAQH
jgi:hypothetical protein